MTDLTSYDVPTRHLGPFVRYSKHFSESVCSEYHWKLQQYITTNSQVTNWTDCPGTRVKINKFC